MKRSPLTRMQDYWPTNSCPKLPQRRFRVPERAGSESRGERFAAMSFDFLHGLGTFGIIPFLVVLTIVVFFHEFGHFLVARWCGVKVLTFSIGFGPELFGFNDRHGTRWKVSAIPLGGFVQFLGDENAASVPDQGAIAAMSEEDRGMSLADQ